MDSPHESSSCAGRQETLSSLTLKGEPSFCRVLMSALLLSIPTPVHEGGGTGEAQAVSQISFRDDLALAHCVWGTHLHQ